MKLSTAKKIYALRTGLKGEKWSLLFDNVMINEEKFGNEVKPYGVGVEAEVVKDSNFGDTPEEAIINFLTNDKRYGKLFK